MNETHSPSLPLWCKVTLTIYWLLVPVWMLLGLFVLAMGPCPAFSSNTDCEWSRAEELWNFPISQIASVVVGILLWQLLRRLFAK